MHRKWNCCQSYPCVCGYNAETGSATIGPDVVRFTATNVKKYGIATIDGEIIPKRSIYDRLNSPAMLKAFGEHIDRHVQRYAKQRAQREINKSKPVEEPRMHDYRGVSLDW